MFDKDEISVIKARLLQMQQELQGLKASADEASGVVEANIETATITIEGTVTGDVQASDRAELNSNCRVVGDIRAARILIADGASFKGNVDMDG